MIEVETYVVRTYIVRRKISFILCANTIIQLEVGIVNVGCTGFWNYNIILQLIKYGIVVVFVCDGNNKKKKKYEIVINARVNVRALHVFACVRVCNDCKRL